MAQRRMFSEKIVGSDAFMDMPTTSRELYFQLGMYADDDGFISPKKVMRLTGASDDDLKLLITKRFVLPFESGIIVVKHWKINNLIRKDFYKPTLYSEDKSTLYLKGNGAYTLDSSQGKKLLTIRKQNVHLGKDSIGKVTPLLKASKTTSTFSFEKEVEKLKSSESRTFKIMAWYIKLRKVHCTSEKEWKKERGRLSASASELVGYNQSELERVVAWIEEQKWDTWTLETVAKKAKLVIPKK